MQSNKIKYASRIDFFKHIGLRLQEDFKRSSPEGRFIEITKFEEENVINVHKEIIKILINAKDINQDMLTVLDYCLWEVLDNTLNHSDISLEYGAGHGYICCQYFPNLQEIRIMIADCGIGIHTSLTTHPNSEYKDLNEKEAVIKSLEKNVNSSVSAFAS